MTIQELEAWFQASEMPQAPLYLNEATKINDIPKFLESHFSPLRGNPITKMNEPLLDRLKAFKLLVESNL